MKVISIGSDRTLFKVGSPARMRAEAYAKRLGELHVVVFTLSLQGFKELHAGGLHLYPTNSRSKFFYIFDAARIARTLPGDILTVQDPFEAGLVGLMGRRGRPLHVQLHTDPLSPYFKKSLLNRVRLFIMQVVLARAARLRVVSEKIKNSLAVKGYTIPVEVLPIFVDVARFTALQKNTHPRFTKVLLWIGRFEEEKDPALALRAFAEAKKEHQGIGLILLGAGSLLPALKTLAKELGVEANVEFPGWQEPAPYLVQTDLLLVTSKYEGYGRQIIEALASGVPVLSTDVGVAREAGAIVTTEKGFTEALVEWFQNGPKTAELKNYPYKNFEEYVEQYCADLETLQG